MLSNPQRQQAQPPCPHIVALALLLMLALPCLPSFAQDPSEKTELEAVTQQLTKRLDLDDTQRDALEKVFQGALKRRVQMFNDFGIENLGRTELSHEQKEQIEAGILGLMAQSRAELAPFLDKKQLAEYKEFQHEYYRHFLHQLWSGQEWDF